MKKEMAKKHTINPRELWTVVTILLTGSFLRLYRIADYLTFLGDEGRDVLVVKRLIVDHDFILLGPTASVGGFFLGPMYYYMMAPFLWLFRLDPVGPAVMVALFGIVSIFLVYYVGKQFFGTMAGLIASSLYAVSPVVIAYSRSSWNPNLVPFCSILLVFFLWKYALERKKRNLFVIGLIWGVGIQFHYLFSFLMILTFVWLVIVERSARVIKSGFLVFSGFLITFSPFIAFEIRHNFSNTRALFSFLKAGNETGFTATGFATTIGDVSFRSFGRLLYRMPNYELWNSFADWQIILWNIVTKASLYLGVTVFIVFVGQRFFGAKTIKREQWWAGLLCLLWFIFSLVLFGFYRRGIYDYYFGIFFAFPFFSLGVILSQIAKTKTGVLVAVLFWVGLLYFNWEGRPFVYPPNKQLEQTKTIARQALSMIAEEPYNFALLTATNSDHAYRYFFEIWGKKPIPIEQISKDPERKTVTNQLLVICENPSCHPLGESLWEIAGFGRAEIAAEKYIFPVRIFRLLPYRENQVENR